MPTNSEFVYYSELRLSNIKAFTPGTVLNLRLDGRPAPWTLILGENGLGKTTLLQCLALLRPVLNVEQSGKTDARIPDRVEPALPAYGDDLLVEMARVGDGLEVHLEAEFSIGQPLRADNAPSGRRRTVKTAATYRTKKNEKDFDKFAFTKTQRKGFNAPLLVAYGAARHAPYRRSEVVADKEDPAASLFNPAIELVDAVQVLEDLDHLTLKKDEKAEALYKSIKEALAHILPEVCEPSRIRVYGPALPSRPDAPSGISNSIPTLARYLWRL